MSDLTITNGELWAAMAAPQGVDPALVVVAKLDVPIIASNALRKALRKAREEVADVEASRVALLEKYKDKVSDEANEQAFLEEFSTLLNDHVTLAGVRAVKLSELGRDVKIAGAVLDVLVGTFLTDDLTDDTAAG